MLTYVTFLWKITAKTNLWQRWNCFIFFQIRNIWIKKIALFRYLLLHSFSLHIQVVYPLENFVVHSGE